MALAYLCSNARKADSWLMVADHPLGNPCAMIIDHGMREGSSVEARNVADTIWKMGMRSQVAKIRWEDAIPKGVSPNDLPNVETVARQLRYRRLARICLNAKIVTLLTAHHEDDQYETVLMRLLSGHGYRGLQGMRLATDIPECYNIHGAYQSGFVDDQRNGDPVYNMRPTDRQRKMMRRELRHEVDPAILSREIEEGIRDDAIAMYLDDYGAIAKGNKRAPPLAPLETEDGGIMVYRPLLHFSKDRLVATCVENGVPWFEDHTNADQTLTTRNAVRHMYKNHTLPVALQKPAILRLAERCRARVAAEEAQVDRLLDSVRFHSFEPCTGTVVVTPPCFSFPRVPRSSAWSLARRRRRIGLYRHTAALLIRRLISMVTPERELTQVAQLGHVVSMLFPYLVEDGPPPEPKPYVICGVHFVPLTEHFRVRWLLARAPHVSNAPRPSVSAPNLSLAKRISKHPSDWKSEGWTEGRIYDGRYWVRLYHRLPCAVHVGPFEMEHQKPFREALDDRSKNDLLSMLRRYAPGKIRYTLPAIYATCDVSDLLAGGDWWPNWRPPQASPSARHVDATETNREGPEGVTDMIRNIRAKKLNEVLSTRVQWENDRRFCGTTQLLALPTLGISLPGLDDWLRWDIRYRKVDYQLLRLIKRGDRRLRRQEFRFLVRALYRYKGRRRSRRYFGPSAAATLR